LSEWQLQSEAEIIGGREQTEHFKKKLRSIISVAAIYF